MMKIRSEAREMRLGECVLHERTDGAIRLAPPLHWQIRGFLKARCQQHLPSTPASSLFNEKGDTLWSRFGRGSTLAGRSNSRRHPSAASSRFLDRASRDYPRNDRGPSLVSTLYRRIVAFVHAECAHLQLRRAATFRAREALGAGTGMSLTRRSRMEKLAVSVGWTPIDRRRLQGAIARWSGRARTRTRRWSSNMDDYLFELRRQVPPARLYARD